MPRAQVRLGALIANILIYQLLFAELVAASTAHEKTHHSHTEQDERQGLGHDNEVLIGEGHGCKHTTPDLHGLRDRELGDRPKGRRCNGHGARARYVVDNKRAK